jgi:hypothetical protein
MHIRVSRVTRKGKSYEYAQLVESYRRADGVPAVRVLATLGAPDEIEVHNMREALAAARAGKRVAVLRQTRAANARPAKPTANLRYLDIAVLLQLFRDLGLEELLTDLMPAGEDVVPPASVVAALVLQRCVDPGSKLYASRWLPRTALPELLHLAPSSFNNTRLHRVLDDLDGATRTLIAKLPACYAERDGAFASLFLDVTDTWFVGDGPGLAARGKTKEGRIERKVGIVLLCNEHGLPLRWEVLAGSEADNTAMTRTLRSVAGVRWASQAPLVCDRAMGKTAQIREMLATDLRFVTALTVTEFDAYAPTLPHASFADLDIPAEEDAAGLDRLLAEADLRAKTSGLTKLEDDLFVLDLGIVTRADADDTRPRSRLDEESATARAMRMAREIDDAVADGSKASYASAARAIGLAKGVASKYLTLRRLSEQQQRDVLEGKAAHCTLDALRSVAAIEDVEEQEQAFDVLVAQSLAPKPKREPHASQPSKSSQTPVRVRVAVYFNPERFIEERRTARRQVSRIDTFVTELRAKIAASPGRYTERRVSALIDRRLRDESLLEAFDVTVSTAKGHPGVKLELTLNRAEWARRRRYDGFTVLVAHPDLSITGEALCRLYRAKDAVEKDFQTIKSVVQLRPVWHRTDAKVRAHVTLCMLALLLERTLRRALQPLAKTAEAALDSLAECRLNFYAAQSGPGAYCVTQPDAEQRAILKALKMPHLADDDDLLDKIRPR